jgi:MoaD family protein
MNVQESRETGTIKLFGGLRAKAGQAEFAVEAATVGEALAMLCAANEVLQEAIFDGGHLRPHVRVMVNGHDTELLDGLETPVRDGDQIAVFPPIAGG